MKEEKLKNQRYSCQQPKTKHQPPRGITLVALVITVIILLILAGVAISMITGGEGLFSRADNAATRYNEAAENEAKKVNELLEKLKEYGGEGITASDIIADITENNNASEYYGKYVTNYTPDGVTDVKWRIFHIGKTPNENENNIYLIADHYIPRTELPAAYGTSTLPNAGNNSYGSRTAYFSNVISTYSSGTGSIASDNPARNWLSIYWTALNGAESTNNNMKSVAYMMDTRIWNKFNDTNSAKYVIGGPTLELFVESWNKVNKSVKELTATANTTGYYINGSYQVSGLTDSTNLWIPAAQYNANATEYTEREALGMWVASPFCNSANDLMFVQYTGVVSYDYYSSTTSLGFRPLVCLKSNIQLTTTDNGATFQIVGL